VNVFCRISAVERAIQARQPKRNKPWAAQRKRLGELLDIGDLKTVDAKPAVFLHCGENGNADFVIFFFRFAVPEYPVRGYDRTSFAGW
jgi:hypothetical protein